jgi:NAD(P)-dependent dehydrogenase (short-subunit alcohol dehydrogenase family)
MKGKVAIVTGGAGGIGAEVCRAFARLGVMVAVADMDKARAEAVASEVGALGAGALGVEMDVADEDSVRSAVGRTVERFGRVDYLVHCAGNNVKSPLLDMTLEQWRSSLDTHLTGAFLTCREAGRQMVKQGEGGRVVLMSSVAAMSPVPDRGAYSPSKAGLSNMARLLSLEWAQYGINVNAVCPGVAKTAMTEMVYKRDPDLQRQRLKRMPMGREVLPEEIADLVVFLCGDGATYINGASIPIDGGFLHTGFFPEPE